MAHRSPEAGAFGWKLAFWAYVAVMAAGTAAAIALWPGVVSWAF